MQNNLEALVSTLARFRIECKGVGVTEGPTVSLYAVEPVGVLDVSRLFRAERSIAFALGVPSVRILAPIPGTGHIGFEVVTKARKSVSLAGLMASPGYACADFRLPFLMGVNLQGEVMASDLATMPHLLVAGATGQGKSVSLNSLILSLVTTRSPAQVRLVLVDPKKVEFAAFAELPHLLVPVVTETEKAGGVFHALTLEMQKRYAAFEQSKTRNIAGHNATLAEGERLPYIVCIVDEFADLMLTNRKEVEHSITRLAALARAAGIHLVLATQRPSVGVVTGIIKANFPSRLAFRMASQVDARTVMEKKGAEALAGAGDFLFLDWKGDTVRGQGAFVSEREVAKMVTTIANGVEPSYDKGMEKAIASHFRANDDKEGKTPVWFSIDAAIEVMQAYGFASTGLFSDVCRWPTDVAQACINECERRGIIAHSANPEEHRAILVNLNF